jgi:hypothetical protein
MAARWHRSFSVFAEAESESVLAMRIRDSAFFANSRRLRSPPVIGPSYTYFRVLQRLSTSCKWLQAVVIYALKRPASASILCRTRFWPTFFNWLNLAERNCHDCSPEIGICRSNCFSIYALSDRPVYHGKSPRLNRRNCSTAPFKEAPVAFSNME